MTPAHKYHDPKALRAATTIMPWIIWGLAVAFYAYEFLLRVSFGVFTPYLIKDLHFSAAAIGIMGAFFYWAYASMQIPAGVLIDWLGAKYLAVTGIIAVTVGIFLLGTMHGIVMGSFARLLIGFGSAFAFVSAMKFIIIWFPPYRFALLAGLTNLAGYLGATLGEIPVNLAIKASNWRTTSFGLAGLGLIIALFMLIYLKEKPYKRKQVKAKHIKPVAPHIFRGLKTILANGGNWINGLYAGLMVGPTSAFAALWGINFLHSVDHETRTVAAGALSAIFIGVAIGSPIFGWISDRIGERRILLVIASAGALASTLFIIFLNLLPIPVIYALCFLFGVFQSGHVLNFAIAKDINSKHVSGTAIGFANMAVMLGGAFLQPIIGLMLDWSQHGKSIQDMAVYSSGAYHIALSTIPISQAVALIIAIFFLPEYRRKR